MHIAWKKPIWKCCLLYDSNHVTFQKKQNYGESEKINGYQGLDDGVGGGEFINRAQKFFRLVKILGVVS